MEHSQPVFQVEARRLPPASTGESVRSRLLGEASAVERDPGGE
jgi:hypothetical protein